jgi:hypothetical protein
MSSIQQQIHARIEAFATELEALVRRAAIEAVTSSLDSGGSTRTSRPSGAASGRATATIGSAISFERKKGAKRTPEQLGQLDAAIVAFVKSQPGNGVERMAKGLGVPSKDLKPRVAILVDGRKLKKTGVKRATKYFVP